MTRCNVLAVTEWKRTHGSWHRAGIGATGRAERKRIHVRNPVHICAYARGVLFMVTRTCTSPIASSRRSHQERRITPEKEKRDVSEQGDSGRTIGERSRDAVHVRRAGRVQFHDGDG